jgi:hypothetical protein
VGSGHVAPDVHGVPLPHGACAAALGRLEGPSLLWGSACSPRECSDGRTHLRGLWCPCCCTQVETWLDNIYCITPHSTCYADSIFAPPASPPPPPPYYEGGGCAPSNTSSFFCNSTTGKWVASADGIASVAPV